MIYYWVILYIYTYNGISRFCIVYVFDKFIGSQINIKGFMFAFKEIHYLCKIYENLIKKIMYKIINNLNIES